VVENSSPKKFCSKTHDWAKDKFLEIFSMDLEDKWILYYLEKEDTIIGFGGWIEIYPGHFKFFNHFEGDNLFSQEQKDFILFLENELDQTHEGTKHLISVVDDLSHVGFHGALGWKKIKKLPRQSRYKLAKQLGS
jgi:hypothetical protein